MVYQKWLAGRVVPEEEAPAKGKKGAPAKKAPVPEVEAEPKLYIPGDPKYRLMPIDGGHMLDFQYMVMYETKNPKNWQKVYRSKFNPRLKVEPDCFVNEI